MSIIVLILCTESNVGYIHLAVTGGTPSYHYHWNNTNDNIALQDNLLPGTYIITITDANQCQLIDTFNIIFNPILSATINFDPQTHIAGVNIIGGIAPYQYLWSTNATDSIVIITQSGHYSVTITDKAGCTAIAESNINTEFIIPTVFTPNNDNVNDKFEIKGIEAYSIVQIQIFNRWGDKLFEFSGSGMEYLNPSVQWDGKYKGKDLPMGTYLFIIDLFNGEEPFVGNVSILR